MSLAGFELDYTIWHPEMYELSGPPGPKHAMVVPRLQRHYSEAQLEEKDEDTHHDASAWSFPAQMPGRNRIRLQVPTDHVKIWVSIKFDGSASRRMRQRRFVLLSGRNRILPYDWNVPPNTNFSSTKESLRVTPLPLYPAGCSVGGLLLVLARLLVASPSVHASSSQHTSNHAMIVSSSRYWFNYRHVINALSIYQLIKANGIPDSNIVLMLADEYAVNPRNPFKNRMLAAGPNGPTLFDADVQIDYRGDDVRVESFVRALTGRSLLLPLQDQNLQNGVDQPVLATDQDSNILIYLTGHGGDSFFKFQDAEEVLASQLASALAHMHERGQYRHVLLLADTCQAFTLGDAIASPNVTIVGSSLRGESSYAHHSDDVLGLSVIERYTHTLVEFLRGKSLDSLTLQQGLIDPYPFATQRAHVGANDGMSVLKMNQMRMSDFFAASTVAVPKNAATNGAPMKIISDSERILFSQVSPMMDESLQKYQRLSNELPTMAANWNDDRRIFAGVKIATCEHGLFPRRAGAGAEATDSMFLALVTVLIGSIVWSFLLFLATNRNRR